MRTYANNEQIARLAWTLLSKGVTSSKAHLEPLKYVVKGVNYDYKLVDASIATLQLVNGAIRNGQLKVTKAKGLGIG